MNFKEFLEKNNNTALIAKAYSCNTIEELDALAKANAVELTREELEKLISIIKNKTALLSDDELDNVAGGQTDNKTVIHYSPANCTEKFNINTSACHNCINVSTYHQNNKNHQPYCIFGF